MIYFLPFLLWALCFFLDKGSPVSYGERGGGGSSPPPAPQAPNMQETSAQAIQAQIDALPKIFQAQQQWGGQFAQQELDHLLQFGPGYAEAALALSQQFGPGFAEQVRKEQEILAPERVAGSQAVMDYLKLGPTGLSAEDEATIQRQSRAAQSTRGLAESGFGAVDEALQLFGAREALKSQYLNVALSTAGMLPAAGGQTVQANPQAYGGQLVHNVTPSEMIGYQSGLNNFNASIWNTQAQMAQNQSSPWGAIAGGIVGAGLGAMTGGLGTGIGSAMGSSLTKNW
jgi:hypothetical protein